MNNFSNLVEIIADLDPDSSIRVLAGLDNPNIIVVRVSGPPLELDLEPTESVISRVRCLYVIGKRNRYLEGVKPKCSVVATQI